MLRKHWQFHILLIVLVCVHSICPLLCAATGQKLCGGVSEDGQIAQNETESPCCHKPKTDASNESHTSSDEEAACCVSNLELVFPDNSINVNSDREMVGHNTVSIVPFTYFLPVAQEHLLHLPRPPKLSISSLNRIISRRGPPYTHS